MKRYANSPDKMNVVKPFLIKKNRFVSLVILCISLLLTSCEKEVTNIKIPQAPPKLVLAAFISPQDTIIRVSVVKSAPVLGKTNLTADNIKDATVVLSDETNTITLPYNESERVYTVNASSFSIQPGRTYFLQVSNPEGLQASASCTVPVLQNTTLEIKGDSIKNDFGGKSFRMQLQWKDTPGEVNYYRYAMEVIVNYQNGDGQLYTNIYPAYFDRSKESMSDNRLDGAAFTSDQFVWSAYFGDGLNILSAKAYGYLLNTDEPYYRYHQSVRNNSNDNPFAEPTPVYSNVQGGLGVFAAYTRNTVTLKLK